MSDRIELTRTDGSDEAFRLLTMELDAFLNVLDGPDSAKFQALNQSGPMMSVVVARLDGRPAGCGALRAVDAKTVEIKRMYVRPTARGQGVGAAVLRELETWAKETGYERAVLETAVELRPAQRLYESSGFVRVPNYGPYVGIERSLCYAKDLEAS
ncbi:MAG: GNAT family N-acetyltransferase [Armatimonadetes bacterium]|nr:GNAT family N-acetyltransferase [Armatimonadota bacterium]